MTKDVLPCGRPKFRKLPLKSSELKIVLDKAHQKLESWLKKQNLKYTKQRWDIAQLILKSGDHLDAKSIVEKLRSSQPEIGPATVYRTLKVLVEADILKESLPDPRGMAVYEIADDEDHHHDHIICLDCGEIFEFHSVSIEKAQNDVAKKLGFSPKEHHHVIHAKCDQLSKRRGAKL